jgi:hypothetical protein
MKFELAIRSKNIVTPSKMVDGIICCNDGKNC